MRAYSPLCAGIDNMGTPQYRYDALSSVVRAYALAGNITFESAKYMITFLAPDRTPGFWNNETAIQGALVLCWLAPTMIHVLMTSIPAYDVPLYHTLKLCGSY